MLYQLSYFPQSKFSILKDYDEMLFSLNSYVCAGDGTQSLTSELPELWSLVGCVLCVSCFSYMLYVGTTCMPLSWRSEESVG